jgi:uncharacterized protein (TIGR03437 family)
VGFTAQPAGPDGIEEVHLYDVARGAHRTLVSEKFTCAQPLCVACRRTCLGPVHLTADGASVLYSVAANQPLRVVTADGAGHKALPIYSGGVASSPQRVISRAGQLVFSSSAPSGPTFAAAAADVHVVNLDGTGLRQVTRFGNAAFFALGATSSADGALIAFESNYPQSDVRGRNQIWLVRSDGTGLRQISSGSDAASGPSISADGSTVVFVQGGQIKRVKTGDASLLTLTNFTVSVPRDPVLSDDGSSVVFTLGPPSGTGAAVYRIPADVPSDMRQFTPIYTPRSINPGGVLSAAGFGAPSPGSLISVYGTNLGTDEFQQAGSFPLPVSLNGVSLSVNGRNIPLSAVTPWQINAQLPQSVTAGRAEFQVPALAPWNVAIASTSPEVLALPVARNARYSQAAAFHAGSSVPADTEHPAAAGDVIEIYGLGLGVTEPSPEAGQPSPASPPARAVRMPRVQIGGRDASVIFAGLTPGLAGVYQVNVVVPNLPAGVHVLTWGGEGFLSIAVK